MELSDGAGDAALFPVDSRTSSVSSWISGPRSGIVLAFAPTVFPLFLFAGNVDSLICLEQMAAASHVHAFYSKL